MAGRTSLFSNSVAGVFGGLFFSAIGVVGGMGIYMLVIYGLQGREIETVAAWGWTSLLSVMILGGPIAGILLARSIMRKNYRRAVSVIVIWAALVPASGITAAIAGAGWSSITKASVDLPQEETQKSSLPLRVGALNKTVEIAAVAQAASLPDNNLLLIPMNPKGPDSDQNDLLPHFNFEGGETRLVAADVLRVRAKPSAESDHLANLRYGDNVQVREIEGQEGGEWIEIIAQLQGPYLLRRAWGYAPRRFLVDAESFMASDQIKATIDAAVTDNERRVWAERLYAAEPSGENLVRLRDIVLAQGDADRAAQLTNLLNSREGDNLAVCHEGELIWLQGGPYTNDVWRGNYYNVRGQTALEIIRRAYQGQPWYQPVAAGTAVSYKTDRRVRWPWRISTTRVVDPETLGFNPGGHRQGPGYVTAAWNTDKACAAAGPYDFFANYPLIKASLVPVTLSEELRALVRDHNNRNGRKVDVSVSTDMRAYEIPNAPNYVVVAYNLSAQETPAYETVLILNKDRNEVSLQLTQSGGSQSRIDRLSVVQNGKTHETYLIVRERQAFRSQNEHAIADGKVLTLYSLTPDSVMQSAKIPVRLEQIYPHTLTSPTRAADEVYHRTINGVPEPEPLKRPLPPARRVRSEADRLSVDAPVPDLFEHWLSSTVWRSLDQRWTSSLSFRRIDATEDRKPLTLYLPGLNADGQQTGKWVRLTIGEEGNNWNGAVFSTLTIGEPGFYPERLPNIAYGTGVVELPIYGKTGSRHLITPPGEGAVFINLPEGDAFEITEYSHREALIGAQQLYPIGADRPVLRVAPNDEAAIIPEAHRGVFAESSQTDNTTHLFPVSRQEDLDNWIRVKRITFATGEAPLFGCPHEAPEPLQVSEGWIRWRTSDGETTLDFSNGVTC